MNYNLQIFIISIAAVFAVCTNCSASTQHIETAYDVHNPKNSKNLLIQVQAEGENRTTGFNVLLDGWQITTGELKHGQQFSIQTIPGKHNLEITVASKYRAPLYRISSFKESHTIDLAPGKESALLITYGGSSVNMGKTILIDSIGLLIGAPLYLGFVNFKPDLKISVKNE